jgi:hypothetical protein
VNRRGAFWLSIRISTENSQQTLSNSTTSNMEKEISTPQPTTKANQNATQTNNKTQNTNKKTSCEYKKSYNNRKETKRVMICVQAQVNLTLESIHKF